MPVYSNEGNRRPDNPYRGVNQGSNEGGLPYQESYREAKPQVEVGGLNGQRAVPQVPDAGYKGRPPGNARDVLPKPPLEGRTLPVDVGYGRTPSPLSTSRPTVDRTMATAPPKGMEGAPPEMWNRGWTQYMDTKIKGIGLSDVLPPSEPSSAKVSGRPTPVTSLASSTVAPTDDDVFTGGFPGDDKTGEEDPYRGMSDDEKRARGISLDYVPPPERPQSVERLAGKQIDYSTGQGGYGQGAKYTDGTYVNPEDDPDYGTGAEPPYIPETVTSLSIRNWEDMKAIQDQFLAEMYATSDKSSGMSFEEYKANLQEAVDPYKTTGAPGDYKAQTLGDFSAEEARYLESEEAKNLRSSLLTGVTARINDPNQGRLSEEDLRRQYSGQFGDLQREFDRMKEQTIRANNAGKRLSSGVMLQDIGRNMYGFQQQERDLIEGVLGREAQASRDEMARRYGTAGDILGQEQMLGLNVADLSGREDQRRLDAILSGGEFAQRDAMNVFETDLAGRTFTQQDERDRFYADLAGKEFLSAEDQRRLEYERLTNLDSLELQRFKSDEEQRRLRNISDVTKFERTGYDADKNFDISLMSLQNQIQSNMQAGNNAMMSQAQLGALIPALAGMTREQIQAQINAGEFGAEAGEVLAGIINNFINWE